MQIKDRSQVYSYSISVCMGSFVFGYLLTSYGNLNNLIVQFNQLTDKDQIHQTLTLLSSILAIAAIFGVGIYRYMIKSFGWIQTFRFTDYLTIIAAVIGIMNLSVGVQTLSRILFGIVAGVNTILIPTYLTSVLPGAMGGPAGTLNQLFIVIGIFFGFWMGFVVVGQDLQIANWRFIVALPIIPALIRIHTAQNIYPYQTVESMIQNQDDERLQSYLELMFTQVTIQQFKQMKKLPEVDILAQKATFFDPRSESHNRRLFMAAGIVFFNQLSGGAALGSFAASTSFATLGESQEQILSQFTYLNLVQIIVTLFAGQFLQKYGRRAFMMEGQRIIIVSLLLIGFIEIFVPSLHILTAVLTFIQMVGFSLCYGPCSFLIGTQILHDIFYPSVLLWIFIFLNGICAGTFINALGIGALSLIYCAIQIIGFLYISGYLIETQGRSRQSVYQGFRKGIFPNPLIYLRNKSQSQDIELPLMQSSQNIAKS